MRKSITLIIAEDQKLLRKGLIALLEECPRIKVIAEANNGRELIDLLKTQEPNIVLLDIEMPLMNGKEALGIIRKRFPHIKVIMLSVYADSNYISEFMSLGAKAYLSKSCDADELITAIETVHKAGQHYDTAVSDALLNGLRNEKTGATLFDETALSDRETEILKKLCEGKTNREIADSLHITHNTVDFHRGNIYAKTKCKNVAELVKYAIRNGIITMYDV